ncbi:MAG: phospho-sugar mutase [Planctomycetes bacterium]|nr:phospho-sugar mutase [Planctomycetota bacterium]
MARDEALGILEQGSAEGRLTTGAVSNIRRWLTEPRFAEYASAVESHLREGRWKTLDDVFWTVIPFGTGGRRGRMYPIGSNAINDRTIGESAQGVAEYVLEQIGSRGSPTCAVAYDTRHRSRHFAELSAGILVAAGFRVFFLDDHRSTPQLSFTVRHYGCSCGIMVTASHNPPSDNAVKVYWSTGGQVLPPHDQGIIDRVLAVEEITVADFGEGVRDGRIVICTEESDRAYRAAVLGESFEGPRGIRVLYSPMHGVGAASVVPCLEGDGFEGVSVFEPHALPDGDFPNVPGHSANPENPAVFDAPIAYARRVGCELILATDPDCDRLGCAAPRTLDPAGSWGSLSGNQIGALLADFILSRRRYELTDRHYVVKTLVTTELIQRIADAYGVRCVGDLLVGFKWIGAAIDEYGPDRFVFGTEESHGYLVGQYARDKDGAVAAMLLAELAAAVKRAGKSLHEQLDALYLRHGYHAETQLNLKMEGSEGMSRMTGLMRRLRQSPPESLAGMPVVAVRDYVARRRVIRGRSPEPLAGPKGDLIMLDFAEAGNCVAVRPSGTEPKVKCYLFAYAPVGTDAELDPVKRRTNDRMTRWEADLRAFMEQGDGCPT